MARADELRLMTKVSRLYYQQDLSQSQIARNLGLSQATISRLLQSARNEGIVRITVSAPNNVHTDLEDELAEKFQLKDLVVVECHQDADEKFILREIGSAAAFYIESSI